ncbi:MAG: hypothetical protein V4726_00165 [Verrucomicrobiota bacterium]
MRIPPLAIIAPLFAAVAALPSCTAVKPEAAAPPPKYGFIENVPMESTANVQRSADIRAYPVGRYVDAANRDVLHERHIIYRRERPEQWRLNSDKSSGILLGPTVGLRNPVAMTNPPPQALTAELNKQRLITRQLLEIQERASSGDERAQALLSQAAAMKDNQDKLVALIQSHNTRLDIMQRQLDGIRVPPPGLSTVDSSVPSRPAEPSRPARPKPESSGGSKPEIPTGDLEKPGLTLPLLRR